MKGSFFIAALALLLASAPWADDCAASTKNIDAFLSDFTAEWIRGNPNLATSTRYFSGDEQDRLERQVTPQTGRGKL